MSARTVLFSVAIMALIFGACGESDSGWDDMASSPGEESNPNETDSPDDSSAPDSSTGDESSTTTPQTETPAPSDTDDETEPEPIDEDVYADGDNYEAPGTNPFVVASHDPLSTFAIDVDTASYDIFRRDVLLGTLPNPNSVRLEEYVNAFSYGYEAPDPDALTPFSIDMMAAPSPVADTTLLRVGIQGIELTSERKPANLVFLIDVSGSMSSADKLGLVQLLLTEALDVLDEQDTISVVTYAGNVAVRLEPTPVSERNTIELVINNLTSGGSTAGASGLDLAYEQAEEGYIDGGINHIVLCTDGDFNVGPWQTDELVEIIEERRTTGVTLTVLGFGRGNLNDDLMESISNAGNGIYAVIANEDQAIHYAHSELLSTILHIAKDVKIQVEFNPELVYAYRLLGYENRALEDDEFRDDTVDAGEIGSGHRVTALYELVLAGSEIPSAEGAPEVIDGDPSDEELTEFTDELCRVRVRYKEPGANEETQAYEVEESLFSDDVNSSFEETDGDFQWATAIAAFAEILKGSPYAHDDALDAISSIVDAHVGTSADRREFQGLFGTARTLLGN